MRKQSSAPKKRAVRQLLWRELQRRDTPLRCITWPPITCTNRDIIYGLSAGELTHGELMPELIVLRKRPRDPSHFRNGSRSYPGGEDVQLEQPLSRLERLSICPCLASFLYCPITRDMFEIIAIIDFMHLHVHSHPELAITPDYCDTTPECPNPYRQRKCFAP